MAVAAVVFLLVVPLVPRVVPRDLGTQLPMTTIDDDMGVRADDEPPAARVRLERMGPIERSMAIEGRGALLEAASMEIVVADAFSRLQIIDASAGDVDTVQVLPDGVRLRPTALRAVGDLLLFDTGGDLLALVNGQRRPVVLARDHRSIVTADAASTWVYDGVDYSGVDSGVTGTASRLRFDGTVHNRVPLPALAQPLAGTTDGLVVRAPGSISVITGEGSHERITRGEGLASDGTRLAHLDCDGDLSCDVVIGTLVDPDLVRTALAPAELPADLVGVPRGRFSPDGRWLALPLYRTHRSGRVEQSSVAVIDVVSGVEAVRIEGSPLTVPDTPFSWSPDSKWLAVSTGTRLQLWDAEQGDVIELAVRVAPTYALAVR